MKKRYYVNHVLPKIGMSMSVSRYRNIVMELCKENNYPFQQAIGSLGGARQAGTISIINGMVTRIA